MAEPKKKFIALNWHEGGIPKRAIFEYDVKNESVILTEGYEFLEDTVCWFDDGKMWENSDPFNYLTDNPR